MDGMRDIPVRSVYVCLPPRADASFVERQCKRLFLLSRLLRLSLLRLNGAPRDRSGSQLMLLLLRPMRRTSLLRKRRS
jgi:hypothetical protein